MCVCVRVFARTRVRACVSVCVCGLNASVLVNAIGAAAHMLRHSGGRAAEHRKRPCVSPYHLRGPMRDHTKGLYAKSPWLDLRTCMWYKPRRFGTPPFAKLQRRLCHIIRKNVMVRDLHSKNACRKAIWNLHIAGCCALLATTMYCYMTLFCGLLT